ncbi:MAG: DUF1430 domain-containing protein, partial [Clostridiaceae bacterium]
FKYIGDNMKKIFCVFFLITNLFLFMNIYNLFCEKDISDTFSIFGYNQKHKNFSVSFHTDLNNKSPKEFISFLKALAENNNVEIIRPQYNYADNKYIFYIMSTRNIAESMGLVTTEFVDFINESEKFYTNNSSNINGSYFYLLNPDLQLKIYPLNKIINAVPISGEYTVYCESDEDLLNTQMLLQEQYGNFITGFYNYNQELLNIRSEYNSLLKTLLTLAFIITMIILLFMLSQALKKISLLKLNGYSSFNIAVDIFAKYFLYLIFLSGAMFSVLFFVTAGEINVRTIPFATYLAKALMAEIPLIVLILLLNTLILKALKLPKLIKNHNFNKPLLNTNYFIKICFLTFFLPYVFQSFSEVTASFMIVKEMNSYEAASDVIYLEGFKDGHQFDGYDLVKFYEDRDDPVFLKYQEDYEYFNKMGAIYFQGYSVAVDYETSIPSIAFNMNYLNKYPVYYPNGGKVTLNNTGKKIYILVPEKYMHLNISPSMFLTEDNETEIIPISNNNYYYNFYLMMTANNEGNGDSILMVYTDDAFRMDKSIFNGVYFQGIAPEELNDNLEKIGYKDKVEIRNLEESRSNLTSSILKHSNKALFFLIITFLLTIGVNAEYDYLYFKAYKKRIIIKKLTGYSFFPLYLNIIIEGILAYIIPLAIMYRSKTDINYRLLLGMIALEVLILLIFDRILNRNRLASELKEV